MKEQKFEEDQEDRSAVAIPSSMSSRRIDAATLRRRTRRRWRDNLLLVGAAHLTAMGTATYDKETKETTWEPPIEEMVALLEQKQRAELEEIYAEVEKEKL